jgi:glycosyltransferase involved in cell wall biosynthesis
MPRPSRFHEMSAVFMRSRPILWIIFNPMPPILSIITAVRGQLEYNKLFLDSIESTTRHSYELIIIDNGSTDGSPDFFEKRGAIVIRNRENSCYACSQNQGLKKASGTYVAFLNNDIYLSSQWDRRLIDYLEEYSLSVISPCGTETLETGHAISLRMRRWKRVNAGLRLRRALGYKPKDEDLLALIARMYGDWNAYTGGRSKDFRRFLYPGLSGFALLSRRSLFDSFGPWTREITASDFDMRLRLVKAHFESGAFYQPMIAGDVFVHHFIRTTSRTVRDPYRCSHPFVPLSGLYAAQDQPYAKIPAASVIVAVYNKPEFLEKVLLSLLNQTHKDFEVVVADDGSGPEIAEVIGKYRASFLFPVQHVRHEHSGFRKTIIANKAVIRSRSDYLVFIDGDSLLHRSFLEQHLRKRKINTILSGRRVMLDKELTERITVEDVRSRRIEKASFWIRHCDTGSIKHGVYAPFINDVEVLLHSGRHYGILGANFSLYRGDYYRINGYDERIIGRGLEDDNLANRFRVAGLRIRTMSRRAIQYHLFHCADPIPHSAEVIKRMGTPAKAWSSFGLIKCE